MLSMEGIGGLPFRETNIYTCIVLFKRVLEHAKGRNRMTRLLTIIAALLLSISMIFANGSQEAKSAESDDGLSGTIP